MNHLSSRRLSAAGILLLLATACPAVAIEMFTYFGDGSRIGLPSLEVPVQAYPGIPLRSDRLRARGRAKEARRAATASDQAGRAVPDTGRAPPPIPGGGIRIRPMPAEPVPSAGGTWPAPPVPATIPSAPGRSSPPASPSAAQPGIRGTPEPVATPAERPLPGLTRPVFPPRP